MNWYCCALLLLQVYCWSAVPLAVAEERASMHLLLVLLTKLYHAVVEMPPDVAVAVGRTVVAVAVGVFVRVAVGVFVRVAVGVELPPPAITWNSATCPPVAPLLAVNESCT